MEHAFFALAAHSDVAKLELEDGIVRGAASAILRDQSTIARIVVDVPTERSRQLSVETLATSWDAVMIISAEDPADCVPPNVDELLVDVATVSGQWNVTISELRDIEKDWVGAVTPGQKVSFVLQRSAGVDPASFDGWLSAAGQDCAERMDDGGCRVATPSRGTGDAPFDSVISFWFPTEQAFDDAIDSQLFASILTSHLVDNGSIQALWSVEHRRLPNPNAWEMPDGPLMPVPEPEPEP